MIVEAGDIGHGSLHDWFIPTRVGRTRTGGPAAERPDRFIPTRVGRTMIVSLTPVCRLGSSPRVWGGRSPPGQPRWPTSVHPHACGADARHHPEPPERRRFIPTRVGRTTAGMHLRQDKDGSSPRVWGGPGDPQRAEPDRRFIPTRVGRTLPRGGIIGSVKVHPHACGADT